MKRSNTRDVDEAIVKRAHSLLPYVKLANLRDVDVSDIRDVPTLLVALFEALTSEQISDRQMFDGGRGQALTLQKILDTLENTLEHVSLSHLSGPGLVRLDRRQLSEALDIFDDLLQHMFKPEVSRDDDLTAITACGATPGHGRLTLSQLESPEFRILEPEHTPTSTPKLSTAHQSTLCKEPTNVSRSNDHRHSKREENQPTTARKHSESKAGGDTPGTPTREPTGRFDPYRKVSNSRDGPIRKMSARSSKSPYIISKSGPPTKQFKKSPPIQTNRQKTTRDGSHTRTNLASSSRDDSHAPTHLASSSRDGNHRRTNLASSSRDGNHAQTNLASSSRDGSHTRTNLASSSRDGSHARTNLASNSRDVNYTRATLASSSRDRTTRASVTSKHDVHLPELPPQPKGKGSISTAGKSHKVGTARKGRPSISMTRTVRPSLVSISDSPKISRNQVTRKPMRFKTSHPVHATIENGPKARRPSVRSTKVIRHCLTSVSAGSPQHHNASTRTGGHRDASLAESPKTSSLCSSINLLKEFHNIEKRVKEIKKERRELQGELRRLLVREEGLKEEEVRLQYVFSHLRGLLELPLKQRVSRAEHT